MNYFCVSNFASKVTSVHFFLTHTVRTHTIGYVQLYNTNKYELYLLLHT